MSEYIEYISIKLNLDTSKAKEMLDDLKKNFDDLNGKSYEFGKNMEDVLDKLEKNVTRKAFDLKNAFNNIFKHFAGYGSLPGLLQRYTFGTLEKDWYEQSLQRRTAANNRSNSIHDYLATGTQAQYEKMLIGSGSVGKNKGVEHFYRNPENNYDRNILNKTNFLPGTKRWRISKFPTPFDKEDKRLTDEYLKSLADVKYQFDLITREIGRELLPHLTKLLGFFAKLTETNKVFRKSMKYGFIATQVLKLVEVFVKLNKVLAIIKWLPVATTSLTTLLSALGLVAAGSGAYFGYKKWLNRKDKKSWMQNSENTNDLLPEQKTIKINDLGLYSGAQKILQTHNVNNTNGGNHISYNIDNLEIKTNAKNIPSLLNDVRKTTVRDNTFIMNNANFGAMY